MKIFVTVVKSNFINGDDDDDDDDDDHSQIK